MNATKTFNIGDDVLLLRLMGEELQPPLRAYVVRTEIASLTYSYMLSVTSLSGKQRSVMVKEDWICPADLLIQEQPDTPWEEWLV